VVALRIIAGEGRGGMNPHVLSGPQLSAAYEAYRRVETGESQQCLDVVLDFESPGVPVVVVKGKGRVGDQQSNRTSIS
jgi:hypothetical protein